MGDLQRAWVLGRLLTAQAPNLQKSTLTSSYCTSLTDRTERGQRKALPAKCNHPRPAALDCAVQGSHNYSQKRCNLPAYFSFLPTRGPRRVAPSSRRSSDRGGGGGSGGGAGPAGSRRSRGTGEPWHGPPGGGSGPRAADRGRGGALRGTPPRPQQARTRAGRHRRQWWGAAALCRGRPAARRREAARRGAREGGRGAGRLAARGWDPGRACLRAWALS